MGKTYQVQVIGLKGEKKTIDVANTEAEFNNTTVAAFKEKLVEKNPYIKDGILTLIYTNIQLEDEGTFSKYNIQERSLIMAIVKLPGGIPLDF